MTRWSDASHRHGTEPVKQLGDKMSQQFAQTAELRLRELQAKCAALAAALDARFFRLD